MTDFTVGGVMGGTYFHEWDDNYKYSLEEVKEKIKYIEDMKKECRIKEINEQIKRLKKEKKEMKEDKSVDLDDLDYKEYYNLLWVNTGAGSFWLSGKYNWNLSTEGRSQILVPTKK